MQLTIGVGRRAAPASPSLSRLQLDAGTLGGGGEVPRTSSAAMSCASRIAAAHWPPRYSLRMTSVDRITRDPAVMGGRPCVRGLRVTVGTIVGLLAAGHSIEQILSEYPYLEREDVLAALSYAAWRAEEVEVPLKAS